jgi:DNA-binding beta-propeller fold protein YncE
MRFHMHRLAAGPAAGVALSAILLACGGDSGFELTLRPPPIEPPVEHGPPEVAPTSTDPLTEIVATIETEEQYLTVAAVSRLGFAFVTQLYTGAVHRVDLSDFSVTSTVPSTFRDLRGVVFTASGLRAYVAATAAFGTPYHPGAVVVLDSDGDAVTQYPTSAFDDQAFSVALSPDGQTVYVGTSRGNVYGRNVATGQIVMTSAPGGVVLSMVAHPTRPVLYAIGGAGVVEIDTRTGVVTEIEESGGHGSAQSLAISPSGRELYIAAEGALGGLRMWDTERRRFFARIPISGSGAFGVAVSPNGDWLYVTTAFTTPGWVYVVERAELAVEDSIVVGGVPQRLAISPDGETLVVPNATGWIDIVR